MGRCIYQGGDPIGAYGCTNPTLGVGMGLRRKRGTWCCSCRWMGGEFGRTGGWAWQSEDGSVVTVNTVMIFLRYSSCW